MKCIECGSPPRNKRSLLCDGCFKKIVNDK